MVKIGFIGLGHNGMGHIEAHKRVGKSEIIAICDRNPKRLKEVSKKLGIKRIYNSAEELCSQSDIEAVSINTGDQYHLEPFIAALEQGKHIFIEKPLANTIDQVETMIAATRRADKGLKIAVGYILRFNPVFEAINDLCSNGAFGEIFYMEADYIHNLLYQANQTDTFTGINWYLEYEKPMVGGGSHPLDLLRWFSKGEVVEVVGYSNHKAFPAMKEDDCQIAIFKFNTGAIAKVGALYGPRTGMAPYYNLRIYGTKGTAERDQVAISKGEDDIHPEFKQIEADRVSGHPYDKEVENWIDAIQNNQKIRCNIYDGANSTIATIFAVEAMKFRTSLSIPIYAP